MPSDFDFDAALPRGSPALELWYHQGIIARVVLPRRMLEMVRWLTVLLLAGAALAGPFEKVPAGSPAYADLRLLADAGLDRAALLRYEDGRVLTRFECALIWNAAYLELRRQVLDRPETVERPNPRVRQVCEALIRLLETFGEEIAGLDTSPAEARVELSRAPYRLATLTAAAGPPAPRRPTAEAPPVVAAIRSGYGRPDVDLDGRLDGLALFASHAATGRRAVDDIGARFSADLFGGSEAGVSLRGTQLLEYDEFGPSHLLVGHVLAADLRFRLGDHSVLLEYGTSIAQRYLPAEAEDVLGRSLRATFLKQLSDSLSVDVGYARMSSGFTAVESLFEGQTGPDLYGLEAGVNWQRSLFGLQSHAAVYRPEGQSYGYVNQLDTRLRLSPNQGLQLSLFYQCTNRRRLGILEDAWRNVLEARVAYDVANWLRADVGYRYEAGDSRAARDGEHLVGASLGLDF